MQGCGVPAPLHAHPPQRQGQIGPQDRQERRLLPLQLLKISLIFFLDAGLTGSMCRAAGSYAGTRWATSRLVCMWRTTSASIPTGHMVSPKFDDSICGC